MASYGIHGVDPGAFWDSDDREGLLIYHAPPPPKPVSHCRLASVVLLGLATIAGLYGVVNKQNTSSLHTTTGAVNFKELVAEQLTKSSFPLVHAAAQAGKLAFFAGNKYQYTYKASPPGVQYPWLKGGQVQVVEPNTLTTLVLVGGVAEGDGYDYQWTVGGKHFQGRNVSIVFTEPNTWTDVAVTEIGPEGDPARISTGQLVTKYVRRELRALDLQDRDDFLDAMETLYRVPTNEGVATYGPGYRDAYWFVRLHNTLAGTRGCDHAHDGQGFLTVHMAMSLDFEKVLQLVNPAVSLPYWDYTIEATRIEATGSIDAFYDSEVFADDVLGGFPADGSDHVIKDGRWAYIPVSQDSWPDDVSPVTNGYGLLRSPWNQNPALYLTRGRTMFGADFDKIPTCGMHYDQMKLTDWASFGLQIQYKPHGSMHTVVAGGWGVDYMRTFMDRNYWQEHIAHALPLKAFGFQKDLWRFGLLQCMPEGCDLDADPSLCTCTCGSDFAEWVAEGHKTIHAKLMNINLSENYWTNLAGENIEEELLELFCNMNGETPYLGDAMSSAAPVDPSFWPMHPTADRLWHWRRINGMTNDTWPADNYMHQPKDCWGHNEFDVLNYKNLFDKEEHFYTNRELYDLMDPTQPNLPFVYDNFEWPHCAEEGYPLDLISSSD